MIHRLESRRLLAVSLDGGLLSITGTGKRDIISVFIDPSDSTQLDVKVNKVVTPFALSSVTRMFIRSFAGNDQVEISHAFGDITIPATIYTDAGDDLVNAGKGKDRAFLSIRAAKCMTASMA